MSEVLLPLPAPADQILGVFGFVRTSLVCPHAQLGQVESIPLDRRQILDLGSAAGLPDDMCRTSRKHEITSRFLSRPPYREEAVEIDRCRLHQNESLCRP